MCANAQERVSAFDVLQQT